MKRDLLSSLSTSLLSAVGALALVVGISQPSQATFPGRSFSCSNPGPGLQTFPGSPNALISSPSQAIPGFPTQSTIAVFGDVLQGNGRVATGETRCMAAMQLLNNLNTANLTGQVAITYQPRTNGSQITGADVCIVPMAAAGARSCGIPVPANPAAAPPLGNSYVLFTISQSPTPIRTAANIAETLGSLSLYVPGSSVSPTQVDGRDRIPDWI
jgi:hypothetical protein